MEIQDGLNCALSEISGINLSNPKSVLIDFLEELESRGEEDDGPSSVVMFTTAGRGQLYVAYGERFATFLRAQNLGTVTSTPEAFKNKNTGRFVRVYFWAVNWKALKAWAVKNAVYGYYKD